MRVLAKLIVNTFIMSQRLFSIQHAVKLILHFDESGISVHLQCYVCVYVSVSADVFCHECANCTVCEDVCVVL